MKLSLPRRHVLTIGFVLLVALLLAVSVVGVDRVERENARLHAVVELFLEQDVAGVAKLMQATGTVAESNAAIDEWLGSPSS